MKLAQAKAIEELEQSISSFETTTARLLIENLWTDN